jgi:integrase/recombinase XerD
MIQLVPQLNILLAYEPVDFRKGIDSLVALCKTRLDQDPFSGALFVFRNRSGTALKLFYRDSLILLLRFLVTEGKRETCDLDLDDIEPDRVLAFLNHLEIDRHNTVPTRNVRLAAIHAFFRYVGARHPDQLERAQRILGVPFKRGRQRAIEYLEQAEIEAILFQIDRSSRAGRRDYALLATMFNTGARVQEVSDLRACDLQLTHPYQLRLFGKGRKERFCPLWSQTAQVLREFCEERKIDLRSETRVF